MADNCERLFMNPSANQTCACVTMSPTGELLVNGTPYAGGGGGGGATGPVNPTSGISAGALNPAVAVAANQIQPGVLPSGVKIAAADVVGELPANAIPCAAVLACISAAPAGSIPADKIGGGAAGQILTADASGNGVWATAPSGGGGPLTAAQVATAVNSGPAAAANGGNIAQVSAVDASGGPLKATPAQVQASGIAGSAAVAAPATGNSLAKVAATDAAGAPVSASPSNIIEAAVASSANATGGSTGVSIARVVGVDASGKATDAAVVTVGQSTTVANAGGPVSAGEIVAITAPSAGLYAISSYTIIERTLAAAFTGNTSEGGDTQSATLFMTRGDGSLIYHGSDKSILSTPPGTTMPAGLKAGTDLDEIGLRCVLNLAAGEKITAYYTTNGQATFTSNQLAPSTLTLVKLADNHLA